MNYLLRKCESEAPRSDGRQCWPGPWVFRPDLGSLFSPELLWATPEMITNCSQTVEAQFAFQRKTHSTYFNEKDQEMREKIEKFK